MPTNQPKRLASVLVKRFWSKVKKTRTCWLWTGCIDKDGRGRFGVKKKNRSAARFSWFISNGTIPDGFYVLHHCDVPPCVNPKHLYIGTQLDNMQDMVKRGRQANQRGMNNGNCKLTEATVKRIKRLWKSGCSRAHIVKITGVKWYNVDNIVCERRWTHIAI